MLNWLKEKIETFLLGAGMLIVEYLQWREMKASNLPNSMALDNVKMLGKRSLKKAIRYFGSICDEDDRLIDGYLPFVFQAKGKTYLVVHGLKDGSYLIGAFSLTAEEMAAAVQARYNLPAEVEVLCCYGANHADFEAGGSKFHIAINSPDVIILYPMPFSNTLLVSGDESIVEFYRDLWLIPDDDDDCEMEGAKPTAAGKGT